MPIPAVILGAAQNYKFNDGFLVKTVSDLKPEEWLKRPADNVNHMAWLVGHVAWTRARLISRVGGSWQRPDLDVFSRGTKVGEDSAYPSPQALLDTWRESGEVLAAALESVSEDLLAQPATQGPPSPDGKISGIVNFLAVHETYHIGQASYLRGLLGYKGLMG